MNKRLYLLEQFKTLFPQFVDDIGNYYVTTGNTLSVKSKSFPLRVYIFTYNGNQNWRLEFE